MSRVVSLEKLKEELERSYNCLLMDEIKTRVRAAAEVEMEKIVAEAVATIVAGISSTMVKMSDGRATIMFNFADTIGDKK